jgi:hypothetical protein
MTRLKSRFYIYVGVGVSSLIGLKAQVAKKQSESKAIKDGTVSLAELRQQQRYRGSLAALLNLPNPGVEKRRKKDEATGRQEEDVDRLKESQEALERKAALYDRMQKGEALNMDEYDKYEVDFLNKDDQIPKEEDSINPSTSDDILSSLIFGDVGTECSKADTRPMIGMSMSDKRRELILEIEKETKGARERAKLQREARLQAQTRKREKLKQAYIQKRAASLATNNQ